MKRKRRYKRGYPVAILVSFEDNRAVFWNIFSQVVKHSIRLSLDGKRTDEKNLYNFHELIVEKLKPSITEGVRSIVLLCGPRNNFAQKFVDHVTKHHRYLIQSKNPNRANFAQLVGSADDHIQVFELVNTTEFKELIKKTTSEEANQIVYRLEKQLYDESDNSIILYSLKEIENQVYNNSENSVLQAKYLLLTNEYLDESCQKSRIHRLIQIAKNKNVKTKVINAKTSAGTRINQFGGIIFFTKKKP